MNEGFWVMNNENIECPLIVFDMYSRKIEFRVHFRKMAAIEKEVDFGSLHFNSGKVLTNKKLDN